MTAAVKFDPVRRGREWLLYPELRCRPWLVKLLREQHGMTIATKVSKGRTWWTADRETWLRVLLATGLGLQADERIIPEVRSGIERLRQELGPICSFSALLAGEAPKEASNE